MNLQQAQTLTQKILAGEASPEEKAALQQYLTDHAHLPELADNLLPLQELENMPYGELPAGIEQRILHTVTGVPVTNKRHIPILRKLLRISAAAVIFSCILLTAYWLFTTDRKAPAVMQTIVTPAGKHKEITLADGSHVRLNGSSTLRFPETFNEGNREVYLDGEAFFDVSQNDQQPFIIHSSAFTTKVLGTSFNIRSSSEVAVATGKVQVSIPGQNVYVTQGEKVSFHAGELHKNNTAVDEIGAWRNHRFYYDQTPLSLILADLERSYGLHFSIQSPALLNCTFSATFKNMPAKEILQTLSVMSRIKFHQKDSVTEVSGNTCN